MAAPRLQDREFPFHLALTAASLAWEADDREASDEITRDAPSRLFVRRTGDDGTPRYAYFAGRTAWSDGPARVCEGFLFEVSPRLRRVPNHYPSDGHTFHAVGEAIVTDDALLLPKLRKAFR